MVLKNLEFETDSGGAYCRAWLSHPALTTGLGLHPYNNMQAVILKKSCFIQELISVTRHDGKPANLVQTGPYERSRYHNIYSLLYSICYMHVMQVLQKRGSNCLINQACPIGTSNVRDYSI